MVQFESAIRKHDNKLMHISSVDRNSGRKHVYICPGCHGIMLPVLGSKREHHFRHKGQVCGYGNYLHSLAEETFIREYEDCLLNGRPFYLKFNAPFACDKSCWYQENKQCSSVKIPRKYDLTEKFVCIRKECRITIDDSYRRPDILLETADGKQLWVEIFVTHEVSKEKVYDADTVYAKIIEIRISDENCDGFKCIRSHSLAQDSSSIRFFHFDIKPIKELPAELLPPCKTVIEKRVQQSDKQNDKPDILSDAIVYEDVYEDVTIDYVPADKRPPVQSWVDLRLPSEILWSCLDGDISDDLPDGYIKQIPKKKDINELKKHCHTYLIEGRLHVVSDSNRNIIYFDNNCYKLNDVGRDYEGVFYYSLKIYALPSKYYSGKLDHLHIVDVSAFKKEITRYIGRKIRNDKPAPDSSEQKQGENIFSPSA